MPQVRLDCHSPVIQIGKDIPLDQIAVIHRKYFESGEIIVQKGTKGVFWIEDIDSVVLTQNEFSIAAFDIPTTDKFNLEGWCQLNESEYALPLVVDFLLRRCEVATAITASLRSNKSVNGTQLITHLFMRPEIFKAFVSMLGVANVVNNAALKQRA